MIWVAKDLEWLRPYLDLASTLIPQTKKLTHIRKTVPRSGEFARQLGCMTWNDITKKFTMTLYVKYRSIIKLNTCKKCSHPRPLTKIKILSKIDILSTFAHELAHLVHWEHTPQHKMLEAKLTLLFMAKLLESRYISEEKEIAQSKKDREC